MSPTSGDLPDAWRTVTALLRSARDVVLERPTADAEPTWAARPGWRPFIESLTDAEVDGALRLGLARATHALARAPTDLRELAETAQRVETAFDHSDPPSAPIDLRGASPRKRIQVDALAAVVEPLARAAERVVDVGSGHGHLSRHLACVGGKPVLGLDHDPSFVATATQRAAGLADVQVEFALRDVLARGLDLGARDLAVGLHACGALGDALVEAGARSGAAIALVSCCLQRRPEAARAPLSTDDPTLSWPSSALGLSNRSPNHPGVAGDLTARRRARRDRLALTLLLRARGLDVEPGAAMRGINRRQAGRGLAHLAARAWPIRLPDAPAPTRAELDAAERKALRADRVLTRYTLVRELFARPLEVFVALDRARALMASGHRASVRALFAPVVSPRNVLLLAHR